MEGFQGFPWNIIFEILTRITSLKTLDICKCVCKEWRQLIDEPTFIPTYCKRTKNVYGFFIQDIDHSEHLSMFVSLDQSGSSIKCLRSDTQILAASCNHGLLCCLRHEGSSSRYFVCKPTTEQWQALPYPNHHYRTNAFGMVVVGSSPLRYKIVRLSRSGAITKEKCIVYQCEVFDSKLWAWRRTKTLNLPYLERIPDYFNPCIFVHTSFHWLTNYDNVIAYHEPTQYLHMLPLPKWLHKHYNQLHERRGRLAVCCNMRVKRKIELWVMQDRRGIWMKETVIDIRNLMEMVDPLNCLMGRKPAAFYDAKIIFFATLNEVVFVKVDDGSFVRVELHSPVISFALNAFQFRSDLEHVDLK